MLNRFKCIGFLLFLPLLAYGEPTQSDTLTGYVLDKDTLLSKDLPEVVVVPQLRTEFGSRREMRYYGRLIADVKITLPLAKLVAGIMLEVNDSLQLLETNREQNAYLKVKEKVLFAEYEPVLRKMNVRQGRLLLKLIDRECQLTSYEVVKLYRGGFSAFFWQGIARVFGNNLKSVYDPYDKDAMIEEVIQLIEAGII